MKNVVGSPVYGDNFINREKELKTAIRLMHNGNSFLLLGIRRTGKSSFLKQVARNLKENERNVVIEMDCSTLREPIDFYKTLHQNLPDSLKKRFQKTLSDSKQLPEKVVGYISGIAQAVSFGKIKLELRDQWLNYGQALESLVSMFFEQNRNIYLFLDELPFFFENMTEKGENQIPEITMILSSLKAWRNKGLPMGIAGSLNLHQQLDTLEISRKLLSGLNTMKLLPFDKKASEELINRLLKGKIYDWWTPEITKKLLDLMPDHVPYFIQYAFNSIVIAECDSPASVETVYHNEVMPGLFTDFVYQFEERMQNFEGTALKKAMATLDVVAIHQTTSLQPLQKALGKKFDYATLIRLIDFEFLYLTGQQEYQFTLNILRNWWLNKRNLEEKVISK